MNFKKIAGAALSLCSIFTAYAQVKFDNSFSTPTWRKSVAYAHPNFQYSAQRDGQTDGSFLRYSKKIGSANDDNDVYFAAIEYPGEGIFYGFTKIDGSGTMIPLFGALKNDNVQMMIGHTPAQWKKMSAQKPNFKDEKQVYIPESPFSSEYTVNKCMQFQPNGVLTYSVSTNYTKYAQQEIAGEYSTPKGLRGRKTTTELTGGWYFDVKGKASISGRWTVKGDSIKLTFTKPTTTVTTAYNEAALIDQWREEDAMRYIPFELDTYRRQYMAQSRADYPNYMVREEKEAVKEMLDEQMDLDGFKPGTSLTLRLYGMNKDEIMASGKLPVMFTNRRDVGYFTPGEAKRFHKLFLDYNDAITADEMRCRCMRISEQILSTDCPVIKQRTEDGAAYRYDSDRNTAIYYVISRGENGAPQMYKAEIPFEVDKTNINREKFASNFQMATDLEDAINEFKANETRLSEIANNKNGDKKVRKQVKNYLSKTRKQALPATEYNDFASYVDALKGWLERIKAQKEYLNPTQLTK